MQRGTVLRLRRDVDKDVDYGIVVDVDLGREYPFESEPGEFFVSEDVDFELVPTP